MFITPQQINWSAALSKREIFNRLFPGGGKVTIANARLATGAGLSLRCAAKQLMSLESLLEFQGQAARLLALYRENTSYTREALQAVCPTARKLEWMDADAIHSENKVKHWGGYLDGLATAFVVGLVGKLGAA